MDIEAETNERSAGIYRGLSLRRGGNLHPINRIYYYEYRSMLDLDFLTASSSNIYISAHPAQNKQNDDQKQMKSKERERKGVVLYISSS